MRTPVNRVRGKAAAESPEDLFANELAKRFTVARDKTLEDTTQKKSFVAGIVLPEHKIAVEIQEKQENKAILAEMARERIARSVGWSICRFNEKEILGDIDSVYYKINREIQRRR